jgi:hypothetical protein
MFLPTPLPTPVPVPPPYAAPEPPLEPLELRRALPSYSIPLPPIDDDEDSDSGSASSSSGGDAASSESASASAAMERRQRLAQQQLKENEAITVARAVAASTAALEADLGPALMRLAKRSFFTSNVTAHSAVAQHFIPLFIQSCNSAATASVRTKCLSGFLRILHITDKELLRQYLSGKVHPFSLWLHRVALTRDLFVCDVFRSECVHIFGNAHRNARLSVGFCCVASF